MLNKNRGRLEHRVLQRELVLALFAVVLLAGCGTGGRPGSGVPSWPPGILDFTFSSTTDGLAIANQRLMKTSDGGVSWTDITPAGAPGVSLMTSELLGSNAWTAVSAGPSAVIVYRSADGGQTWQSSAVSIGNLHGTEHYPSSLFFLNPTTGWLVAKAQSGSAHDAGDLYRTDDGGKTWQSLSIPIGDRVRFHSLNTGWAAGGAANNLLYVTRDGGSTWQLQHFLPPAQHNTDVLVWIDLPTFFDASHGVVPVQFGNEAGDSVLEYFVTQNDGQTWSPTAPAGPASLIGRTSAVVDATHWIVAGTVRLFVTADGGGSWTTIAPDFSSIDPLNGKAPSPHSLSLTNLSFVSATQGWAILISQYCAGQKAQGCTTARNPIRTSDSGHTWQT